MDTNFFEDQIKRLKLQWPNSYSPERLKVFFNALRDVSNYDFRDAVTYCLANQRSAPMLSELTEAIAKAKSIYFEQKRIDELKKDSFLNIENNGGADPEFVAKCKELITAFWDKKITKKQFDEGCDLLDQAAKLYRRPKLTPPTNKTIKPYKDDDEDRPF
jgi:hypothetical protein